MPFSIIRKHYKEHLFSQEDEGNSLLILRQVTLVRVMCDVI